jgi:hypothetical protein
MDEKRSPAVTTHVPPELIAEAAARRRAVLEDRLSMIRGLAGQAHESMADDCGTPAEGMTYLGMFDAIRGLAEAALATFQEEDNLKRRTPARQRRAS